MMAYETELEISVYRGDRYVFNAIVCDHAFTSPPSPSQVLFGRCATDNCHNLVQPFFRRMCGGIRTYCLWE